MGVDGSTSGRAALGWAAATASQREERVTAVAVVHLPVSIAAFAADRDADRYRDGLESDARRIAIEQIRSVNDPAVIEQPLVVEGHPAAILLEHTGPNAIVVVGRRGISALKHRLLGSVSQYLGTHALGPVVIVPETWASTTLQRIVVGFDGSEHAAAALRWAIDIAPTDAEVTALIAVDVIPWLRPELVQQRHPEDIEAAQKRLLAAADEADPAGRATRTLVLHSPHQALAEACGDADLVVVGPRGLGGIARTVLGSVTAWLLHEAPCPVAVVPSL